MSSSSQEPTGLSHDVREAASCPPAAHAVAAAAQLSAPGPSVANVIGGIQVWQRAGPPTVTHAGAPGTVT